MRTLRVTRRARRCSSALTAAAACQGVWKTTAQPSPVRAVHVALLHTGKVLLVAGSGNDRGYFDAGTFKTSIWDPTTETVPGRVDAVGRVLRRARVPARRQAARRRRHDRLPRPGHEQRQRRVAADLRVRPRHQPVHAASRTWRSRAGTRPWSSSATGASSPSAASTRPGLRTNTSQIFNGSTWTRAEVAAERAVVHADVPVAAPARRRPALLLGRQRLRRLGRHARDLEHHDERLDRRCPGSPTATRRDQGDERAAPAGAGPEGDDHGRRATRTTPVDAVASTAIVDLKAASPTYTAGPAARHQEDVRERGDPPRLDGLRDRRHVDDDPQRLQARATARRSSTPRPTTWTKMASPTVPRAYHSSALLLPDGRVATFGGNPEDGFEMRIEIFSPPYLQTGADPADDHHRADRDHLRRDLLARPRPRPRRCAPRCWSGPRRSPTRWTRTSGSSTSRSRRPRTGSRSRSTATATSRRRAGTCSSSSTAAACRQSRSGSTSADGPQSSAPVVAPARRSRRERARAHDLDDRVAGEEQDRDPPEGPDLPEERRPLERRGQVRVPLLGRDVGAARRERDRRERGSAPRASAAARARGAPRPRRARRPTGRRRLPATNSASSVVDRIPNQPGRSGRTRRAARPARPARARRPRWRSPGAPRRRRRRRSGGGQVDPEAQQHADDRDRDRPVHRPLRAPIRCSTSNGRPGRARAHQPAVPVAVGERRPAELLAVRGRLPARRCCSGPARARTASSRR